MLFPTDKKIKLTKYLSEIYESVNVKFQKI